MQHGSHDHSDEQAQIGSVRTPSAIRPELTKAARSSDPNASKARDSSNAAAVSAKWQAPVVVASTHDDSLTLQTPGKMKRAKTVMEMPVAVPRVTKKDRLQGHCCLFFSYLLVIFILMILFSTVPLASHNAEQPRNETGWRRACDDNDLRVLDTWGLS